VGKLSLVTVSILFVPWKVVSPEFKRDNTIIDVNDMKIGGKRLTLMTGPCAVEGGSTT
jgi:3-deoxy-7-phosphoheptulonate synthase